MSVIKPLLAVEAPDFKTIRFPVTASPKLDGIRAFMTKAGPQSRSGKIIPNKHVQDMFKNAVKKHPTLDGLDGELIVGEATDKDVFRQTTSAVMSIEGQPKFRYFVFDHVAYEHHPFKKRLEVIENMRANGSLPEWVVVVPQVEIKDVTGLTWFEEQMVSAGYEGLIIRDPNAAYKHGRSSAKEGIMLKVRRFKDSEATIVDFEEELENTNVATRDAFGRTERSSHKDNMIGKGSLGAFVVRDLTTKKEFKIGTGYDAEERKNFWKNRSKLKGKIVKYRFFEVGVKDLPRFPVFQGFRDKKDMS